MSHFFPLEQLDVIGYTEVPIMEPAMPHILSPIFSVRQSDVVLFPPYCLDGGMLFQPHLSDLTEFADLLAGKEISAIRVQAAQAGHDLWFDDEGSLHYEPAHLTSKHLGEIYARRMNMAGQAWDRGEYDSARQNASVAYAADVRKLDPLILCGAVELHLGKTDEFELTADLAEDIISREEFTRLAQQKGITSPKSPYKRVA